MKVTQFDTFSRCVRLFGMEPSPRPSPGKAKVHVNWRFEEASEGVVIWHIINSVLYPKLTTILIYIIYTYCEDTYQKVDHPCQNGNQMLSNIISDKTVLDMSFCDFNRIESLSGKRDWLLSTWQIHLFRNPRKNYHRLGKVLNIIEVFQSQEKRR